MTYEELNRLGELLETFRTYYSDDLSEDERVDCFKAHLATQRMVNAETDDPEPETDDPVTYYTTETMEEEIEWNGQDPDNNEDWTTTGEPLIYDSMGNALYVDNGEVFPYHLDDAEDEAEDKADEDEDYYVNKLGFGNRVNWDNGQPINHISETSEGFPIIYDSEGKEWCVDDEGDIYEIEDENPPHNLPPPLPARTFTF